MGLSREVLAGIEASLHEHAGLDLPEWVVETRALSRMGALNLDERAYLDLLESPHGERELSALVELVRVGETSFFRHLPQVGAVLDVVVPAWRARENKAPRVWSAGCATGEEAYTLAMVLARAAPRRTLSPTILATDVSAEAIAIARRAAYPAQAVSDVPEAYRDAFVVEGDVARVRPEIATLVQFQRQNLADADPPRGLDLVWCRNVLIYFGPEARRRVLARIVAALAPGGFLFVGYSETLRDIPGLTALRHGDQVLWQKEEGAPRPATIPPPRAIQLAPRTAIQLVSKPPSRPISTLPPAPSRPSRPPPTTPPPRADRPEKKAILRVTSAEPAALSASIRTALAAPGLGALAIDLDGADFLDDAVAPVLRRAMAAAEAAGIALSLLAARPGPQRWLRRNGLPGGHG